jgi:hypothetical protein
MKSSRVAARRILPLDVFSTAPGGARTTTSGGTPTAPVTRAITAASSASRADD